MLPVAVANPASEWFGLILQYYALSIEKIVLGFSANSGQNIEKRMNNEDREPTICFKVPDNGQYYIVLTMHKCIDYTCEYIEGVHDCYITCFRLLDTAF